MFDRRVSDVATCLFNNVATNGRDLIRASLEDIELLFLQQKKTVIE